MLPTATKGQDITVIAAFASAPTNEATGNEDVRVRDIGDNTTVTVIELETAEVLSTHHIEPTKTYWRNTRRAPGR